MSASFCLCVSICAHGIANLRYSAIIAVLSESEVTVILKWNTDAPAAKLAGSQVSELKNKNIIFFVFFVTRAWIYNFAMDRRRKQAQKEVKSQNITFWLFRA